jgi:F-type H+-transporting ATPase subunit a
MASKNILFKVLLAVFLLGAASQAKATGAHEGEGESKEFNPGTFILDHIGDSYDWHILTYNKHHVSVPLPVILYSKQSGLHVFMSSKFHHGTHSHAGFIIAPEEHPNKGKIVEEATGKRPALDLSITKNVFALFVSIGIFLAVFLSVAKAYTRRGNQAPKGLQSWVEPVILFVRDDIARPAIGHRYKRFMPYLLTLFFFILINNLMGLIPFFPFGANVSGNIAITLVLALITFIITICSSNKGYWIHLVNAPGVPLWLKIPVPLMPIVEIMGVFIKPFVLMIRLFANITAGHIVALGFFSLIFLFGKMGVGLGYGVSVISVLFTVFMSFLELLVAFIQAYVFTLLSALYFGMAAPEEHH